jgi:hypothetical protein
VAPGEMSCFSCSFGVGKTPEKVRYLDAHLCRCLDMILSLSRTVKNRNRQAKVSWDS